MEKQNKQLTLGSLFSGSGGFELAGMLCGIRPLWASEIEPFAVRVTTKRLPDIRHYGDVSALDGAELPPVDIITFGSPCQDMSIAGKRAGLDGSRSNLFYEAVRIVKEMRCATNGKYPRFIVWENVPGAFSSNKGDDFKTVLEAVCSVKGGEADIARPAKWPNAGEILADDYSVAWRVFDAQYWGVPQRRKRIYLVTDFDGGCAGKILFESEGVSGYSAAGFRSWQRAAGGAETCSGTAGTVCLNDQGGQRMDITDDTVNTLRAEAHHPPCVLESAGFCTEHSAQSRSIGYEKEKSPTLRAGTVPAVFENHSQDTRYTGPLDVAQTVSATYGMGGNNQPFVVEDTKSYDVRFTSEGTRNARANVYETDTSRTIDTGGNAPDSNQGGVAVVELPKAYGVCSKHSHSMQSDNPKNGFYEAKTSRTIDCGGTPPTCSQGGMAVVESYAIQGSMIGRKDENGPQGDGINKDVSFTLNTADRHAVYAMTTGAYTQVCKEKSPTLMARDYKDPAVVNEPSYGIGRDAMNQGKNAIFAPAVSEEVKPTLVAKRLGAIMKAGPEYSVRRLTPTECARLQGFPDWWCAGLATENPTDEDIAFWRDVFETHRKVIGTSTKPKSDKQIIKWLKNPYSDSAEYRLWGNGIALPNAVFVLAGIAYYAQNPPM
ncbi:MAG: DNA cytosine methyltransferase [Ruminococcus flavefaciens]|nr:DNA cytosine methyltransferase [Ruminococcus flavefaciens]